MLQQVQYPKGNGSWHVPNGEEQKNVSTIIA